MRLTRGPVVLLLCLAAGCMSPDPAPEPVAPAGPPPGPSITHDLTVRVSQETAGGPALPGAEVQAFVLDETATSPAGRPIPRSTDTEGFARFAFDGPVRVAVRATAPGWTSEGVVLQVRPDVVRFNDAAAFTDPAVAAVVSERDLFLPLFRTELRIATATSLMTATVRPAVDGSMEEPVSTVDLALPDGLAPAYLARLVSADVRLAWTETATEHADLSAGLAWDGRLWVAGEPSGPAALPGDRSATFSGLLPGEGRPSDLAAATLQAAAVTNSAVVGDVPLGVEATLRFTGRVPAGLPAACHSSADLCPPVPPVLATNGQTGMLGIPGIPGLS